MAYDPNAPIPNDPYGRTPANFGFQTAINPQTGQEQFFLPASEIANISSQFGQGFIGDPSTWASQVQNADQEQGVYGTQDPLQYLQGLYRQTRDININPVLDPSTGGAFIDPATLGYAPRLDIGEKFPTGLKGALQFTGDVLTQTPIGTAALSAGLGALGRSGRSVSSELCSARNHAGSSRFAHGG